MRTNADRALTRAWGTLRLKQERFAQALVEAFPIGREVHWTCRGVEQRGEVVRVDAHAWSSSRIQVLNWDTERESSLCFSRVHEVHEPRLVPAPESTKGAQNGGE